MFVSLVSLLRMSATRRSWFFSWIGPLAPGWIHESDYRLVDSPFPIALPRCISSRSLPMRTPLQPWEMDEPALTLRKEDLWQYLPQRILDSPHNFWELCPFYLLSPHNCIICDFCGTTTKILKLYPYVFWSLVPNMHPNPPQGFLS